MKISQYAFLLAEAMKWSLLKSGARADTSLTTGTIIRGREWHIDGWIQIRVETRKKKSEVKPQFPGSGLEEKNVFQN